MSAQLHPVRSLKIQFQKIYLCNYVCTITSCSKLKNTGSKSYIRATASCLRRQSGLHAPSTSHRSRTNFRLTSGGSSIKRPKGSTASPKSHLGINNCDQRDIYGRYPLNLLFLLLIHSKGSRPLSPPSLAPRA